MKYFGVTTAFYDNGKIKGHMFEVEVEKMPENDCLCAKHADIYWDYFETQDMARAFLTSALNNEV